MKFKSRSAMDLVPLTSSQTLPASLRSRDLPWILLPLFMAATLSAVAQAPPPSEQNLRLDAPIQNWDDAGTTIGAEKEIVIAPVKARFVRLNVFKAERPININEFQVFAAP